MERGHPQSARLERPPDAAALDEEVDEFVRATRQSDDITCLVFRSR